MRVLLSVRRGHGPWGGIGKSTDWLHKEYPWRKKSPLYIHTLIHIFIYIARNVILTVQKLWARQMVIVSSYWELGHMACAVRSSLHKNPMLLCTPSANRLCLRLCVICALYYSAFIFQQYWHSWRQNSRHYLDTVFCDSFSGSDSSMLRLILLALCSGKSFQSANWLHAPRSQTHISSDRVRVLKSVTCTGMLVWRPLFPGFGGFGEILMLSMRTESPWSTIIVTGLTRVNPRRPGSRWSGGYIRLKLIITEKTDVSKYCNRRWVVCRSPRNMYAI